MDFSTRILAFSYLLIASSAFAQQTTGADSATKLGSVTVTATVPRVALGAVKSTKL